MRVAFLALLLVSLALVGCLQEKQLGQATPSVSVEATTASVSPGATSTPVATASSTPSSTSTPTSTATATPQSGASCVIYTPNQASNFPSGSEVSFVVNFVNTPASAEVASVKCDVGYSQSSVSIKRNQNGANAISSCIYSSVGSYIISAVAGGASCTKQIFIT